MGDIAVFVGLDLLAALSVYCLWHGIRALRTGIADSPTMMSPGTTKRSEAPFSFWVQVGFWLVAAVVIGYNVLNWALAIAEA
jgi:hypothetical protein